MVIGFPVYADRLPSISGKIFENIKGNNTLAVVVTSYGNRDYGDALLELKDKMEERGFIVISAAAIIGEHCLNTSIARNRPDKIDKNKIRNYGLNISKKLQEIDNINDLPDLDVKGNYPYPALKDQHTSPITLRNVIFDTIIISMAMGEQNAATSLTKINRTTHLTGPATDIGIHIASRNWRKAIFWILRWISFPIGAMLGFIFVELHNSKSISLSVTLLLPAVIILSLSAMQKTKLSIPLLEEDTLE